MVHANEYSKQFFFMPFLTNPGVCVPTHLGKQSDQCLLTVIKINGGLSSWDGQQGKLTFAMINHMAVGRCIYVCVGHVQQATPTVDDSNISNELH